MFVFLRKMFGISKFVQLFNHGSELQILFKFSNNVLIFRKRSECPKLFRFSKNVPSFIILSMFSEIVHYIKICLGFSNNVLISKLLFTFSKIVQNFNNVWSLK